MSPLVSEEGREMSSSIAVVWFKRDLRVSDHRPLWIAYQSKKPIVPLFILEPSWRTHPDYSPLHEAFLIESLISLADELRARGLELLIVEAEAIDTFKALEKASQTMTIYSHNEHGNSLTYARDRDIARWINSGSAATVSWREFQTNGVERGRCDRAGWASKWNRTMTARQEETIPLAAFELGRPAVTNLPGQIPLDHLRERVSFLERQNQWKDRQRGGRSAADSVSDMFFSQGILSYRRGISKPLLSRSTCSRLSPYLSFGIVSMREVFQRSQKELEQASHSSFQRGARWGVGANMRAFQSRLHWHCHFIQKFESECRIEHENFNREFDTLRNEWNEALYLAWERGETGFPLIDASMRCVRATGYLNFRSRAMVISFLTHLLWLDWKRGAHFLARCFLDYEPGIHYPQVQMQATTTGIHTIRIYNPVKQAEEHDGDAAFIKEWLPELRALPALLAREPWRMTPFEELMYGVQLGKSYPHRCIDLAQRAVFARDTLWQFQKKAPVVVAGQAIVRKHREVPSSKHRTSLSR